MPTGGYDATKSVAIQNLTCHPAWLSINVLMASQVGWRDATANSTGPVTNNPVRNKKPHRSNDPAACRAQATRSQCQNIPGVAANGVSGTSPSSVALAFTGSGCGIAICNQFFLKKYISWAGLPSNARTVACFTPVPVFSFDRRGQDKEYSFRDLRIC